MSTNKGFLGWGTEDKPGDEKLLAYLWNNKHHTPFEMAGMTVEIQAPIFVFREWHRHRTQSYNEMSARYVQMPNLHFIPTEDRVRAQDTKNKQATGLAALPAEVVESFLEEVRMQQELLYESYESWIRQGIPKELARINTPVSRMSRMRASANLRNWLAFLSLRWHPAAQEEIRDYAIAVGKYLQELFPRTFNLWQKQQTKR